jgi:opacity protein-like surface antigen
LRKLKIVLPALSIVLSTFLTHSSVSAAGGSRTFNGMYVGATIGWSHNQLQTRFTQQQVSSTANRTKNSLPVGFHLGMGSTTKKKIYLGAELGVEFDANGKAKMPSPPAFTISVPHTVEKTFSMVIAGKFGYNTGKLLPYVMIGPIMSLWRVNMSGRQVGNQKILPGLALGVGFGYQWGKHVITSTEYRFALYQKHKLGFKNGIQDVKVLGDYDSHNLLFKLSFVI